MKTEIGICIVTAALAAVFMWCGIRLEDEPFYVAVGLFMAAFWGSLSGLAFWAAMNRWEERHAAGQWPRPTVIMSNRRRP